MYKIKDIDTGDEITGKFYERELSKVETELHLDKEQSDKPPGFVLRAMPSEPQATEE